MIHFTDIFDKAESSELPALSDYKEIKPILETSNDSVQKFWDDVFSEEESSESDHLTEDEIIAGIFERNEDEFTFDLDTTEKDVIDVFDKFKDEKWEQLNESQKLEVVEEFSNLLCEKMGIDKIPELKLFEAEENYCGAFDHTKNTMELNRNILNNPKEVISTIAHEMRHAYQYQRACIGETKMDTLYAINFLNYVSPVQVDDKYVNFNDYQNQLLEAEARAYAKQFGKEDNK